MRIQRLGGLLLSTLFGVAQVLGISQRDAGLHDWHLELMGLPATEPGTSPRFHYPAGPSNTASSSLVYTATQKNVLAALDPKTGAIAWRHIFPESQPILKYELHGDSILAVTGPGGAQAHLFSATSGHSKWSLELHSPADGLLPEPASIATDARFYQVSDDGASGFDILCLSNGHTLRRVNGMSGQTTWSWTLDLATEPTMQLHAILPSSPSSSTVQVLLIKRVTGSYNLFTAALSRTGSITRTPMAIKNTGFEALDSLLIFEPAANTVESRAVYLDTKGDIKSLFFFQDGQQDPIQSSYKAKGKYSSLVSVGLQSQGIFVGKRLDGTSTILQVGSDGQVKALHEYLDSVENGLYAGFVDREGITHVSRYSISTVLGLARMATFTVEATEHNDAGMIFDSTFPYSPKKNGQILHVASEIAPRKSANLLFRLCITTASGSFQGWLGGGMQWAREEGLAHLSYTDDEPSIAFLVVPSASHVAAARIIAPTTGSLKSIMSKPLQVMGILPEAHDISAYTGRDWLGDAFGYRKLVLVGTSFGKLYALDLGNSGQIIWESYASPSNTKVGEAKALWEWKKIAIFDKDADGRVLVAAIAQITTAPNRVRVQAFYLDGLTGKPFARSGSESVLSEHAVGSILVNQGSFDPAFLLISPDSSLILEESPPSTVVPANAGGSTPPHLSFVDTSHNGYIQGWHALISSGSNPVKTEPSWKYLLPEGSRIVARARQTNGKVASLGRVLGDRSTLYKSIDPHLLAVVTLEESTATLVVHLIDIITGTLVFESRHVQEAGSSGPVAVSLTENWLAYSYTAEGSEGKHTRIVSVELFENVTKEEKASTYFSSYARHQPFALSKAYIFPGQITSMTSSQTKHGVTSKALLVTTSTDQIVAIPRRFLDPRRPMQKPTKAEMEEYLVPYEPVLPVEPKWVVSHRYRVAGVKGILTSSTILESTSQILAYGLDMFGSSVSPSGRFDVLSRDFNKAQLIATTLGLMGAIAVLRPIVNRKKLKERWYPA